MDVPGYRRITVKPQVVGDLEYARASLKTVRGPVKVGWKKGEKSFEMRVTIPPNTTARVHVPKMDLKEITVTESGEPLWQASEFLTGAPGIAAGSESDDYITFEVGSGYYLFRLTGQS